MEKNNLKILMFIVISLLSCEHVVKSDYFFSDRFTGEVAIIYQYDSGTDIIYKDGREQYFVPDSGIILTKERYRKGTLDQKFYSEGNNTLEEVLPYSYQKDTTKNYIYFDRVEIIDCISKSGTTKEYFVKLFYVGKKMDSASNKQRFFFENHIRKLVGCNE